MDRRRLLKLLPETTWNSLHSAVYNGKEGLAKIHLDLGTDIAPKVNIGDLKITPPHMAAAMNLHDSFEL